MFIPQQSNLINMLLQRKSYFRDNNRENVYKEITGKWVILKPGFMLTQLVNEWITSQEQYR